MDEHHIIEWIGVVTLFLFGVTMIVQGHFIVHGKYGYRHDEREKHKMETTRRQIEELFKEK